VVSGDVQSIVEAVVASRKYRGVARDLIAHLAEIEIGKGRRTKEAVKEVKNRLHQAVGAYLDGGEPDYALWLERLASASDADSRRAVCRALMGEHASTRERLTLLDGGFYTRLLGDLPPIGSILDIACGLNPLAIPWMPLEAGARCTALDVLDDLARFYDSALPLFGVNGAGLARDVTRGGALDDLPPHDVALIIKALPCLAQIDRAAPERLLEHIPARTLIVTYPVRSLGGEEKGMRGFYADSFARLTAGRGWAVERVDFPDELAFRVVRS
jgi:16S rRNA (guanine(1405)-N(7))-methyltransferase